MQVLMSLLTVRRRNAYIFQESNVALTVICSDVPLKL